MKRSSSTESTSTTPTGGGFFQVQAILEGATTLRDTLRSFLSDQLPSATLRGMLDTDAGYSPELHARLAAELDPTNYARAVIRFSMRPNKAPFSVSAPS